MTQQLIQANFGATEQTIDDATTPALTLTSLAAGSYRQSAKIDLLGSGLGSPNNPAQLYQLTLSLSFAAAPTAGSGNVQVWVGFSDSPTAGADNCGGCSGADAAYAGYSGGSAAQSVYQLDPVASMAVDANTGPQSQMFSFSPRGRYCYFVVFNNTSQAFGGSSGASKLVLSAENPALQPSA